MKITFSHWHHFYLSGVNLGEYVVQPYTFFFFLDIRAIKWSCRHPASLDILLHVSQSPLYCPRSCLAPTKSVHSSSLKLQVTVLAEIYLLYFVANHFFNCIYQEGLLLFCRVKVLTTLFKTRARMGLNIALSATIYISLFWLTGYNRSILTDINIPGTVKTDSAFWTQSSTREKLPLPWQTNTKWITQ
jgi:hypothetical protein